MEIEIIRDTREKKGWTWERENKKPGKIRIIGTVDRALDSADYSVVGLEDKLKIERKQGFDELFTNLINKEGKERFYNEMEKLRNIPHTYLLVESNINRDILGLSIPQMKFGPPVHKLLDYLWEIQLEYGVIPIFVGDSGKLVASQIFRKIAKLYK